MDQYTLLTGIEKCHKMEWSLNAQGRLGEHRMVFAANIIINSTFFTMTIEKLLNCGTCGCGMAEEDKTITGGEEGTGTEKVEEVSEEGKAPATPAEE